MTVEILLLHTALHVQKPKPCVFSQLTMLFQRFSIVCAAPKKHDQIHGLNPEEDKWLPACRILFTVDLQFLIRNSIFRQGDCCQALLTLEKIFLFLDLDCQNLTTFDFDNYLSSENENSLAEKKLRLRVFLSQSNAFPASRSIYSMSVLLRNKGKDQY